MLNGKKIYKVTNGVREELSTLEYEQAKADLKASAKAKLIAGEALTAEEADTIVL